MVFFLKGRMESASPNQTFRDAGGDSG